MAGIFVLILLKLLIMELEIIRNKVEKFSEEIAREYYLQGAGLKNDIDFALIYQKYDSGRIDVRQEISDAGIVRWLGRRGAVRNPPLRA